MRKSLLIGAFAIALTLQSADALAQGAGWVPHILFFTDRTAWTNAVQSAYPTGTILTETFDGTPQRGFTPFGCTKATWPMVIVSGGWKTYSGGLIPIPSGGISGKALRCVGLSLYTADLSQLPKLTFSPKVVAMGGDWNSSDIFRTLTFGVKVWYLCNRGVLCSDEIFGYGSIHYGFWGFVFNDIPLAGIKNVFFFANDNLPPLNIWLDNVSYVQVPTFRRVPRAPIIRPTGR